jgi:hypothetical protein
MEVIGKLHVLAALPSGKKPGWVGCRAIPNAEMRKIRNPYRDGNPDHPARSSIYK